MTQLRNKQRIATLPSSSRSAADAKFHYWVSEAREAEALGNQELAERYWDSAQVWLDIRNQHDGLAK